MKYYLLLFCSLMAMNMQAQKWMKSARAMQVGIYAYNEKGEMKSGNGIRLGNGDELITDYDLVRGASRVVVTDQTGQEVTATALCGASGLYNVAKFYTGQVIKKFPTPQPCSRTMKEGETVYILPTYNADKKAVAIVDTIRKAETFKDSCNYYTLSHAQSERLAGSAVLNQEGQLVGMLQAAAKADAGACVIDIHFASRLNVSALNAKSADLQAIHLPLLLPTEEEQAATFLYFADQNSPFYEGYLNEFIARYPTRATGYTTKAEWFTQQGAYERADSTYEAALKVEGVQKDEVYNSRSRAAYSLQLSTEKDKFARWDAAFALAEAERASALNALPIYLQQEADCHFLLKQYKEAHQKYLELCQTNMRRPETFLCAAFCLQAIDDTPDGALALMDSAVACFGSPLPPAAASVLLTRGKARAQANRYRDAVMDLNDFERLTAAPLKAEFYYEREQLEIKCRMYPAALSDIERAMGKEPDEPVYFAEAAALNYRLGQIDDAIVYAEKAIALASDFADAYRILGVCYKHKGDKAKAKQYFQKAVELGDELAKQLSAE